MIISNIKTKRIDGKDHLLKCQICTNNLSCCNSTSKKYGIFKLEIVGDYDNDLVTIRTGLTDGNNIKRHIDVDAKFLLTVFEE